MKEIKFIVISNIIGTLMVIGAAIGIVGGSMVVCGACVVGLLIAGG